MSWMTAGGWRVMALGITTVAVLSTSALAGSRQLVPCSMGRDPYVIQDCVRWRPQGDYILTNSGAIPVDVRRRTGSYAYGPLYSARPTEGCDWSPDGRRIVASVKGEICVRDWNPTARRDPSWRRIVTRKFAPWNVLPVWHPNGRQILFLSGVKIDSSGGAPVPKMRLASVDLKSGKAPRTLPGGPFALRPLALAPDGRHVCAVRAIGKGWHSPTVIIRLSDGKGIPGPAVPDLLSGSQVAWLRDSSALIVRDEVPLVSDSQSPPTLFLRLFRLGAPISSELRGSRSRADVLGAPRLSSGGDRLAYTRVLFPSGTGRPRIERLLVREMASGRTRVVFQGGNFGDLSWSPDGRSLAVWRHSISTSRGEEISLLQITLHPKSKVRVLNTWSQFPLRGKQRTGSGAAPEDFDSVTVALNPLRSTIATTRLDDAERRAP